MIQTIITCDVCGTDERGPYPKESPGKYWKGEVAGGRWYKLAMYIETPTEAVSYPNVTIDVCPECAEKLANQLGMDELPSVVEEEEDDQLSDLTVVTSPYPFDPAGTSDNTYTWRWGKAQWTNTTSDSSADFWPVDFTA